MRFPEFEGEWESSELGVIAVLSKGSGISKEQKSEKGNPCILYGELYTTYTTEIIDEVVSRTDLDPDDLVKSKANDIIIPASGETAIDISTARCVLNDDVMLGGDLNIIRLKEQDGCFFSYQLNGVRKKDIAKVAQGVSIVHLHGDSISHIKVNYPSKQEQKKIASLLSLIDKRIVIQSKVIEKYESLIKALYESLIPCEGVDSVQLGSLVQICKGKQLNAELLSETGLYYVMNGGIFPSGYYDTYNTPQDIISISEGGNSCGYVQFNHKPFWSGGHCYTLLNPNENKVHYKYLFHFLKCHQDDIMALRIGSGLPNIQKKVIEKYPIALPNYETQVQLASLFDTINCKKENGIESLRQYKIMKIFLLSELFI